MKNKNLYFIGLVVLVIGIIGYHYVAASQAENQFDEAIQEQTEKSGTISVDYSEIYIAPFSADVTINDLTIIMGNHIERTPKLMLDLGYLDFLNIYFGGVQYGLNHLTDAVITAIGPSYTNKAKRREIKSDSIKIIFKGNALDGLRSAIDGSPFTSKQSINIQGSNIIFSLPHTFLSKVKAQHLRYTATVSESKTNFWTNGTHKIRADSLIWTPSQSFQDKYSFFIKGFGYPTDAVPFQYAKLQADPSVSVDVLELKSTVKSDLALLSGNGKIMLKEPMQNSEFKDMTLSLTEFSDRFSNVLSNIEKLLSISLPKSEAGITIQLQGSVNNPKVTE